MKCKFEIVLAIAAMLFASVLGVHNARLNAQERAERQERAAQQLPTSPSAPDCSDRLSVRDIQISLLREAVKLREREILLLRTQLEYQKSLMDAWRTDITLNGQLDSRRAAIHRKYGADPADYRLTFDMGWEKIDHAKHPPKSAPASIRAREEEDEKVKK